MSSRSGVQVASGKQFLVILSLVVGIGHMPSAQSQSTIGFCTYGGGSSSTHDCFGRPLTPEVIAENKRKKLERERQQATERAERERQEESESAAREAHEASVAIEVKKLGRHREKEARRLVEMREKAEAARPKGTLECQTKKKSGPTNSSEKKTKEEAHAALLNRAKVDCRNAGGGDAVVRGAQCERKDVSLAGVMGISHERMTRMMARTGEGSSQPIMEWTCKGTYECTQPVKVCKGAPAAASGQ